MIKERKGGQISHMYERVMYLKNTADEFNVNHKDILAKIRKEKFTCPMGWMRAQLAPGENDAHETAR